MKTKQAFPLLAYNPNDAEHGIFQDGMNLLEYYAGLNMAALMTNRRCWTRTDLVQEAIATAEALIAELQKRESEAK